jgi:hypothetical protein
LTKEKHEKMTEIECLQSQIDDLRIGEIRIKEEKTGFIWSKERSIITISALQNGHVAIAGRVDFSVKIYDSKQKFFPHIATL